MKNYYLFGAGINCMGVIKFFGKENILAIIDNDVTRRGSNLEGIPIISFDEYLKGSCGEPIIITSYFRASEIIEQLEANGVFNYYKSPYMQTGFFESGRDIVDKLRLKERAIVIFDGNNPMSEQIALALNEINSSIRIKFLDDNLDEVADNTPVIVTYEHEADVEKIHRLKRFKICDLKKIYNKNYKFRNERLIKFKDIHKGERCFIIGNGPSLRMEDLDTLYDYNEICFGVNRIYLSYPNTKWRPNYYVAVDTLIVQNDRQKIQSMEGTKFIRHFYKMDNIWKKESEYEFCGLTARPGEPKFSLDIVDGIYIGNTVVYDAIQIAVYMGFEEIYLLGVDMTSGKRAEEEGAHFYKVSNKKEKLFFASRKETLTALRHAGIVIKSLGRTIKNATRGGELEELERIDFDMIFAKSSRGGVKPYNFIAQQWIGACA